ncbi:MAG: hypothetical protein WA629_03330 [Candidatus Aquilonibacter sp.]
MSPFTLRCQPQLDDSEVAAAEAIVRQSGGKVTWQTSAACKRTYGLVENAGAACATALRKATRATVFDRPVIALAVFPSVREALPLLMHALGGPGGPAGVLACEPSGDGIVVEWDLDVTPFDVVLNLVDLETDRLRAARVNTLLTPLSLVWWTRIAATGLGAPEITPQRVLEEQLEVHGVLD